MKQQQNDTNITEILWKLNWFISLKGIYTTNIFTLQHNIRFLIYVIKLRNIEKHIYPVFFVASAKWPHCQLH